MRVKKSSTRAETLPPGTAPVSTAVGGPAQESTTIIRVPTSSNESLSAQLVECLDHLHLGHYWAGLMPSRVGLDPAVDTAVRGLCRAHSYLARTTPDEMALDTVFSTYGQTLSMLQKLVTNPETAVSDSTLTTVALVSYFECLTNTLKPGFTHSHWAGMQAILAARPAESAPSEVTRALIYDAYDITFAYPIAFGIPSPFDNEHWRNQEIAGPNGLSGAGQTLKTIRYQLSVRLPRLVVLIRAARAAQAGMSLIARDRTLRHAMDLTLELVDLRDDVAETTALHSVRIVSTRDPIDSSLARSSFEFNSLGDYRAAMLYWQFRSMALNLTLELATLLPPDRETNLSSFTLERQSEWRTTQARLMTNLFMSWQYAKVNGGLFATAELSQAHMIVWAGLFQRMTFKDKSVAEVKRLLLPKIHHRFIGWTIGLGLAEMDVACDVLVGGRLDAFHAVAAKATGSRRITD